MTQICPTITASEPHQYRQQMETVLPFADRLHIDLMDGQLAPSVSLPINQLWWPDNITIDVHLMFKSPADHLDDLIKLRPSLLIIHFEAENIYEVIDRLHQAGLKAGLALLPESTVDAALDILVKVEHILVFGGQLGYHGGTADLNQLDKLRRLKEQFPEKEIAWDGGVNLDNAKQITEAGATLLDVGSYIHNASAPQEAYAKLKGSI